MAGADGIAADEHALNHTVGVAFKDGTVHERTGVALVGITDDVLLLAGLVVSGFPLHASGEAGAAAAPETGFFQFLDDRHPVALFQNAG